MKKKINRWLDNIEGVFPITGTKEEQIKVIVQNINEIAKNKNINDILLTSSLDSIVWEELCYALQQSNTLEFVVCKDIHSSIDSIQCLKDCDGVILLEKERKSSIMKIDKLINKVESFQKPILGYILI